MVNGLDPYQITPLAVGLDKNWDRVKRVESSILEDTNQEEDFLLLARKSIFWGGY